MSKDDHVLIGNTFFSLFSCNFILFLQPYQTDTQHYHVFKEKISEVKFRFKDVRP